jgi:hypothetical protein
MAKFCVSCGTPLTGPFCNNCGARAVPSGGPVQATPSTPPPVAQPQAGFQPVNVPVPPSQSVSSMPAPGYQPVQAPVSAAPKGSGLGKVLLWVGGIFLVLFMIGAGAAIYGVYWVKHKVTSYASAITGASSDSVKVLASGDSCRLLSTADLQKVLGVAIEKSAEIVESDQPGCAYYTNEAAFAQLQRMAMQQARRQSEEQSKKPGPKGDNPLALLKDANQLEGVIKTLGMTQPAKDGQVFSFTVERGVSAEAWSGMRVTEAAVPGFEEVPGVGDHAMIGAFGHAFYVQKGDAVITMSTMMVPDARVKGSDIGKKIIGKL